MSIFKKTFYATGVTAVFLSACATAPVTDLAELNLSDNTGQSAIVARFMGKNINYFGVNSLSFVKYDAEKAANRPNSPPVRGNERFIDLKYKVNSDGYVISEISPGTYYMTHGSLPKRWGGCFNKNTVRFEVKPNAITYLGEINLDEFYGEVQHAMNTYKGNKAPTVNLDPLLVTPYLNVPKNYKHDMTYIPKFVNEGAKSQADIRTYLEKSSSKTEVPIVIAEMKTMSFPIGKDGCSQF